MNGISDKVKITSVIINYEITEKEWVEPIKCHVVIQKGGTGFFVNEKIVSDTSVTPSVQPLINIIKDLIIFS